MQETQYTIILLTRKIITLGKLYAPLSKGDIHIFIDGPPETTPQTLHDIDTLSLRKYLSSSDCCIKNGLINLIKLITCTNTSVRY